jgi:hypothetical protein
MRDTGCGALGHELLRAVEVSGGEICRVACRVEVSTVPTVPAAMSANAGSSM